MKQSLACRCLGGAGCGGRRGCAGDRSSRRAALDAVRSGNAGGRHCRVELCAGYGPLAFPQMLNALLEVARCNCPSCGSQAGDSRREQVRQALRAGDGGAGRQRSLIEPGLPQQLVAAWRAEEEAGLLHAATEEAHLYRRAMTVEQDERRHAPTLRTPMARRCVMSERRPRLRSLTIASAVTGPMPGTCSSSRREARFTSSGASSRCSCAHARLGSMLSGRLALASKGRSSTDQP